MTWPEFRAETVGTVGTAEGTASWETMRLEAVTPTTIPVVPVPPQGATPLFDQLVGLWHAQGRQVPGEPDPEWHALVSRGPGRRRRPSEPWWSIPGW